MKKLITLVLTLALFLGINAFLVVNADSVDVKFNKTGLGCTLNAVKNAYIDVSEIKTGSPIFNEDWLENKISNLSHDIISTSDIDIKYGYGGSDKNTSYGVVSFTFDDIPIEKFAEENMIVLRYGASGKNDDDWQNKNVYVQITYSK